MYLYGQKSSSVELFIEVFYDKCEKNQYLLGFGYGYKEFNETKVFVALLSGNYLSLSLFTLNNNFMLKRIVIIKIT